MGIILSSKSAVDHMLDSPFAEGVVRGLTAAVMLALGLAITSEPVMGTLVGILMGVCFSDFVVEKFHVDTYKPRSVCIGLASGFAAGLLAAYFVAISAGMSVI